MADVKVNRHNHPMLADVRKVAYWDGHKDGYQAGYGAKCEALIYTYKAIIQALEKQAEKQAKKEYEDGFRSGYKAAKEDIQYILDELKPLVAALEEKEVDK